jgi:hypothetical protein
MKWFLVYGCGHMVKAGELFSAADGSLIEEFASEDAALQRACQLEGDGVTVREVAKSENGKVVRAHGAATIQQICSARRLGT